MYLLILALLFLSLLLGSTQANCDPTTASLIGRQFRFQSKNSLNRYFRHYNGKMRLDPYTTAENYLDDSAFDIVPGLAGVGISFRSKNYPLQFINVLNNKAFTRVFDNLNNAFNKSATWIPRKGLADANGVSFESYSNRGQYLRHYNYLLQINRPDGSQPYRDDATWYPHVFKECIYHTRLATGLWY